MELYKQAFGIGYSLGIRIPDYFEDQSYKNDTGPSFVYVRGNKLLKICVLPENPSQREVEGLRYTLIEMKTEPGDDYQDFVRVCFESDNPEDFERVVFDQKKLLGWLSC